MIGQDNPTVRRYPWVSYTITAATLIFCSFLATMSFNVGDWLTKSSDAGKVGDVVTYLLARPYLKIPPELLPYCDADVHQRVFEGREAYRTGASRLPKQEIVDLQQGQLDAMAIELRNWRARERSSRQYGFIPARPQKLALFASIFVYPSILHLVASLVVFFVTGPFLEDLYGRPLFAMLYLVSGVLTPMIHLSTYPDSMFPVAAASGAVGGVMGAFLVRLGSSRIRFFPDRRLTFVLPAYVVIPGWWLLEQVWYAREARFPEEAPVSGYVWSFLFGLAAEMVVKLTRLEETVINPGIERQISIVQHPALAVALEMRTEGNLERARREIAKVLAADHENVDAWREAYEIAAAAGDFSEAGKHAARLLDLYDRGGEKNLAFNLAADAIERGGHALPLRFYLVAATFFEKEEHPDWALDLYARIILKFPADPAAFRAFFRQGDILKQNGDFQGAFDAFTLARAHPACTEEWQEAVDLAVAEVRGLIPKAKKSS